MEPVIIIPTFWTRPAPKRARNRARIGDLTATYDHPTPIDEEGTLADCLRSLEQVDGLGKVVVIAAATDGSIEHQAEDRVREIVDDFPEIDAFVFGPAELGSLHRRLEQLEFADMIPGVNLRGYGAVRNAGLIAAAVLGYEAVIFVDDDEIVSPDFLDKAMFGLGARFEDGTMLLAKTGFYTDLRGGWQRRDPGHWSDSFWRRNDSFNQSLSSLVRPPRIQRSPMAFGGCLALHRDMFMGVSFDPWVWRGEDVDYVINARMHGGGVYFDNEWSVVHLPPEPVSPSVRFGQDVYRFIYEQRKLEFAKSQVDLRQVSPRSLSPYPGNFVDSSVATRATVTALLRAVRGPERRSYFRMALHLASEAGRYARANCRNYFDFQRRWSILVESVWDDVALKSLFAGERHVDRTAITGRFPVVPS